jgi:hypothetical protein
MVEPTRVQINLISRDTLEKMTSAERLKFIINEVKMGKVLILECGLTAAEQFELNKLTMSAIDHESFIGIEMPGFSADFKKPGLVDRLFRRRRPPRMMAIGPASLMKIIKKEPSFIQTIVTPGEGGEITGEGIPIEFSTEETVPEARPVEGESEEVSESQSRLDEFSRNKEGQPVEPDSREELEKLIGPELREDTTETGEAEVWDAETKPPESNSTEEPGGGEPGAGAEATQDGPQGSPQGGFIYKKLKEENEGEDE